MTVHVVWWRWRRPKHQASALLTIFLIPLLVLFNQFGGVDFLAAALLHVAMACAYIQTYPVLQALSPSLLILLFVGKSSRRGLSEKEIFSRFSSRQLLEDRIDDLLNSGLVRQDKGSLKLSGGGRLLVLTLTTLRKILGLKPGQG